MSGIIIKLIKDSDWLLRSGATRVLASKIEGFFQIIYTSITVRALYA